MRVLGPVVIMATGDGEPLSRRLRFWMKTFGISPAPEMPVYSAIASPESLASTPTEGITVALVRLADWNGGRANDLGSLAKALRDASATSRDPWVVVVEDAEDAELASLRELVAGCANVSIARGSAEDGAHASSVAVARELFVRTGAGVRAVVLGRGAARSEACTKLAGRLRSSGRTVVEIAPGVAGRDLEDIIRSVASTHDALAFIDTEDDACAAVEFAFCDVLTVRLQEDVGAHASRLEAVWPLDPRCALPDVSDGPSNGTSKSTFWRRLTEELLDAQRFAEAMRNDERKKRDRYLFDVEFVPARSPDEELVVAVFRDALDVDRLGVEDDFFELGGDSVIAIRALALLRAQTGIELPVDVVFDAPTPAKLADRVARARDAMVDSTPAAAPALERISREGDLPLSFGEARVWFLEQLLPGLSTYNLPIAFSLRGRISERALADAFAKLCARHETLRTRFVEDHGVPRRIIDSGGPSLTVHSVEDLPADRRDAEAQRIVELAARAPFDLGTGPVCRAELVRLSDCEHILVLVVHHIVSDGWSQGIIVDELSRLYRGDPVEPTALQYLDFAAWQRRMLAPERLEDLVGWWKDALAEHADLDLPLDRPRIVGAARAGAFDIVIPTAVVTELRALAASENATPFMVYLSAFAVALGRWSSQRRFVVGTPLAGRPRTELERVVGLFVNSLPIPVDLDTSKTLREVLGGVRASALASFAHADVPFDKLVEELSPTRDLARPPIFSVMLTLHNYAGAALALPGVEVETVFPHLDTPMFDLTIDVSETPEGAHLRFGYDAALFEASTIEVFIEQYRSLLEHFARSPDARSSSVDLSSSTCRDRIAEWNRTEVARPNATIHGLFAACARATPDAIAIELDSRRLTYRALDERSNQIARFLGAQGVRGGSFVGVFLDRSIDLVATLLGILKAGAAYLPLDPTYPVDRIAFMLEDVRPALVLTTSALRGLLPDVTTPIRSDFEAQVEVIDASAIDLAQNPDMPAYVIFTSGSTGKPKGALNAHRGVVNRLLFARELYALGRTDKVLHKAPLSFDVSVSEIFLPLVIGARLVVARPDGHRDPAYLARVIAEHGVTSVEFVPSMLGPFLDEPGLAACSALRTLTSSGEALPPDLARRTYQKLPGVRLFNFYGPSETSVDVLAGEIDPSSDVITIGRPLSNTHAYVLDGDLQPVPVGAVGELYIGGMNVGLGYLGRPALTAERFMPDPFSKSPGARMYRTGDLCRWRTSGTIEFRGRVDQQVKLRGQRVELGEIESALRDLEGIRDAIAMVREDSPGDQRLVAYTVSMHPATASIAPADLRALLKEKLPQYMVPNAFVAIDAMPLNPSGKIDRKSLPPPAESSLLSTAYLAPRNEEEAVVASIWQELLQVARVGVHDDFFELGGHSLLAARVASGVREKLGAELPLIAMFESPTVAGVVPKLRKSEVTKRLRAIERGPHTTRFRPSFSQLQYLAFEEKHPGTSSWSNLEPVHLVGRLDLDALRAARDALLERHDVLRGTFRRADDGEAWFEVQPVDSVAFDVEDLRALPPEERAAALRRAAEQIYAPHDLFGGPLFRTKLLRLGDEEHVLLIGYHHSVSDGDGLGIIHRDFEDLYEAFAHRLPNPLPPLRLAYADYARWQREELKPENVRDDIEYWKTHLDGVAPITLPMQPVPGVAGGRSFHRATARISKRDVDDFARGEKANRLSVVLAATAVALVTFTDQPDVLLPIVVASGALRSTELASVVGQYTNRLRIRSNLTGAGSFRDAVARTKEAVFGATAHQVAPVHWTHDGDPLFPMFVNVLPDAPASLPSSPRRHGLRFGRYPIAPASPARKWDFAILVVPFDDLEVHVDGGVELYDEATVSAFARRLARVIDVGVRRPEVSLDGLVAQARQAVPLPT